MASVYDFEAVLVKVEGRGLIPNIGRNDIHWNVEMIGRGISLQYFGWKAAEVRLLLLVWLAVQVEHRSRACLDGHQDGFRGWWQVLMDTLGRQ